MDGAVAAFEVPLLVDFVGGFLASGWSAKVEFGCLRWGTWGFVMGTYTTNVVPDLTGVLGAMANVLSTLETR